MHRVSVPKTIDYKRVAALPRRTLTKSDAELWADILTERLRARGSRAKLRAAQGATLAELHSGDNGACAFLPVGAGKTLIAWLAAAITGSRSSVLIGPASLRDKTWGDFASYHGQWQSPSTPPVYLSREDLQEDRNRDILQTLQPTLIVIDESDDLANAQASASRRIDRYVVANRKLYPVGDPRRVKVLVETATPARNSIMAIWHHLMWTHDTDAPLPLTEAEAKMWAASVDEKTRGERPHPGPLGRNRDAALDWLQKRIAETPGIVIFDEDSCDQPLTIRTRLAREDTILDGHYHTFLEKMENPGGIPVSDPLSRYLTDGRLGCGLYSYYDPPPPEHWREARRMTAKFVRDMISRSGRWASPLDTEGQVLRRFRDHPTVARWREVSPQYDPKKHTKIVWVSDSTIKSVLDWLGEQDRPAIVWCGSVNFAQKLSHAAGLAYYRKKGRCVGGGPLHLAPKDRSMIVSWNACKKGFNLQPWPRQLIVMPPPSAKWLEQIFGRSHRSGATEPVIIDILATSGGTIDLFETAIREARFAKRAVSLTQKILRADIVRAVPKKTPSNEFRWATREEQE